MTGGEIAQIITSVATLAGVVGSILLGWHNSRGIKEVHDATNSMKDELVAVTAKASRAEGLKEGRDEVRPRPT